MLVNVIGGGLAGCECSYLLSKNGIQVNLYEMKKVKKSPAHISDYLGELVCSNSLKSDDLTNACGLLKNEMLYFDSIILKAAKLNKVEAGNALAVNREDFSKTITEIINNEKNIKVIDKEVISLDDIDKSAKYTVIATGPLTSDSLYDYISKLIGDESLYFYDAEAPIIEADSIDYTKAFFKDRYSEKEGGDYLNLPMNKEEYFNFYNNLINGESANRHDFDKLLLFEGCMPIEEMAKRGEKTLTFGMLKPVGLNNPITNEKYYAVVQLRSENKERTAFNMVGFQTSLKFSEQARIFRMIPGLENANFLRYGVMHKNIYINGGNLLNKDFSLKNNDRIFFAGQISGVEGYVESAASGMICALNIISRVNNKELELPKETMMYALSKHVSTKVENYQPMNANFGIILPLENITIKLDKKNKYLKYANRSIEAMNNFRKKVDYIK